MYFEDPSPIGWSMFRLQWYVEFANVCVVKFAALMCLYDGICHYCQCPCPITWLKEKHFRTEDNENKEVDTLATSTPPGTTTITNVDDYALLYTYVRH